MTNTDIVALKDAGVSDELLVAKIRNSAGRVPAGHRRPDRAQTGEGFRNGNPVDDRGARTDAVVGAEARALPRLADAGTPEQATASALTYNGLPRGLDVSKAGRNTGCV